MNDNVNKKGIVIGTSPESPKEVFDFQEDVIRKSELSNVRAFAFERRARLPYLLQKGLSKPGTISFDILRRAATSVHVARICINVLKEKITKTEWVIQPKNPLEKVDKEKIKRVENLFRNPNGGNETFRSLLDKILEDLLVLDIVCLEKTRDSEGHIDGIHYVDGSTIRPVFDDHGNQDIMVALKNKDGVENTVPVSYVQVLDSNPFGGRESGQLVAAWPKTDFIRFSMHPQGGMSSFGYGLSPLEAVIGVVANLLNADNFNGTYFEEGGFPPIIIQLKQAMDQRELQSMREYLYNELEGRYHRPAIIGGEGDVEVQHLKELTQRDMQFMDYIEFMAKLLAAAYGLSGQDIGLTDDLNHATADIQKDLSQAKGYGSVLHLLKEIFNRDIIANDFGYDDIEFVWVSPDSTDPAVLSTTVDQRLKNGTLTLNEARKLFGEEPYGAWADIPMLLTGNGFISVIAQEDNKDMPEKKDVQENKPVEEHEEESEHSISKSIQTKEGDYEVFVDDRGVSQPFIFYDVLTGFGRVIKPPVAVNLGSQKLEEDWTQRFYKEGYPIIPVTRVSEADVFDKILTTQELKNEFNKYQIMSSEYDSRKWSAKYGKSRKFPFYTVSKYVDGRNLKDQLLVDDMRRVPNDYMEAIKDLATLWKMEKQYVLGDRRADQYLITPDKRAVGFDYQFVGNQKRWEGTKNSIPMALLSIPELQKAFNDLIIEKGDGLMNKMKKKFSFKKDKDIPSVNIATVANSDEPPVVFGALINDDSFKEMATAMFKTRDIGILLKNDYKELAFFYNFDSSINHLRNYIALNPNSHGGIIPTEDFSGVVFTIYAKD